MSKDNVAAVLRAYEVFNDGDKAAWLEQFDPEVVWHASEDNPDADTYRGREELAVLFGTWREMFEGLHVEPEEFIDAGDHVVVPGRVRGRGVGSGAEIDMPSTWIWKLREGKTIEAWEYRTKEQALEALGLGE